MNTLQAGLAEPGLGSVFADAGLFARAILFALALFSVASWAIMIDRWLALGRARRDIRRFLEESRKLRSGADLVALALRHPDNPLARVARAGQRELASRRRGGEPEAGAPSPASMQRAMEVAALEEASRLESRLGFLATTGSVSPFVGLLGTVWGIMNAFMRMGLQGNASLPVVAPGIAEALVATAAGLAAAIPAVIGYNYFLGRVRSLTLALDGFVMEAANLAERESAGMHRAS